MPPVNDQQPKAEKRSRAKRLPLDLILLVTSPGREQPKKQGHTKKNGPSGGWKK